MSVLVGHSGVGKSTLVNALVPGADAQHLGGQRGHRARAAHVHLGDRAAAARRRRDRRHARASGRSGWRTSTPTACWTRSPTWPRRRRPVRAAARTWPTPPSADSTSQSRRAGSRRCGWRRSVGCWRARRADRTDGPPGRTHPSRRPGPVRTPCQRSANLSGLSDRSQTELTGGRRCRPLRIGDALLRALSALANPHRLRIVAALSRGSTHVSQLARDLGISRPLVHMHLARLEAAGSSPDGTRCPRTARPCGWSRSPTSPSDSTRPRSLRSRRASPIRLPADVAKERPDEQMTTGPA